MDLRREGQKLFTGLHAELYRRTGGRIGQRMGRVENILLTTTGRRSAKQRTVPLTATFDGDRLVLVASNGGATTHPDWYVNLTAQPSVRVQRGKRTVAMTARTATAVEKLEIWPKVLETYKGYAGYQAKTERDIPLVILTTPTHDAD